MQLFCGAATSGCERSYDQTGGAKRVRAHLPTRSVCPPQSGRTKSQFANLVCPSATQYRGDTECATIISLFM